MSARKYASCTLSHYIAGLPDDRQDGWRDCAIRTSAARSLCYTRAPRRHGARRRLPRRWACRDRASLSDSRHWSASRPCSTSRAGACSSRGNGYVNRAKPSRRWDSAWATNPKPRSVARSSGSLVTHPPRGGAQPSRAIWRLNSPRSQHCMNRSRRAMFLGAGDEVAAAQSSQGRLHHALG